MNTNSTFQLKVSNPCSVSILHSFVGGIAYTVSSFNLTLMMFMKNISLIALLINQDSIIKKLLI